VTRDGSSVLTEVSSDFSPVSEAKMARVHGGAGEMFGVV